MVTARTVTDPEFANECGMEAYDLVCANILPDVLIPLTEIIDRHMKPGAYLLYSGILNEKLEEVEEALGKNKSLKIIDTVCDGEWSAIIIQKEN